MINESAGEDAIVAWQFRISCFCNCVHATMEVHFSEGVNRFGGRSRTAKECKADQYDRQKVLYFHFGRKQTILKRN